MKTGLIILCFLQFIQSSYCSTPAYGEEIVQDSDSSQFGSDTIEQQQRIDSKTDPRPEFYNPVNDHMETLVYEDEFTAWVDATPVIAGLDVHKKQFDLSERDYSFLAELIRRVSSDCGSSRTSCNREVAARLLNSENTPSELDSISVWVDFIKSNWNQTDTANSESDTIESVSSRDTKLSMVRSMLNSVQHNGNQGFSTDLQVRFKLQLELLLASAYYFSLSENSELGKSQKVVISRNFLKKLQGGEEIAVDPLTQEAAEFALDYAGSHFFVLALLEKYLLIDQISMSLSSSSVDDETKSSLSDRLGLDSTQVQDFSENPDAFREYLLNQFQESGESTQRLRQIRSELIEAGAGSLFEVQGYESSRVNAEGSQKYDESSDSEPSNESTIQDFHAPEDIYQVALSRGFNKDGCFPRDSENHLVSFNSGSNRCSSLNTDEIDRRYGIFQDSYIELEKRRQLNTAYRSNYFGGIQEFLEERQSSASTTRGILASSPDSPDFEYVRLEQLALGKVVVGELGLVIRNFLMIDGDDPDASYIGSLDNEETVFIKGVVFKNGELLSYHITRGSIEVEFRRQDVLPVISKRYVTFPEEGFDLLEAVKQAKEAGLASWEYFTN